jgi:transposase
MLTWDALVQAQALRAQGWSISAIARHLDVTRLTVRRYLNGERTPGQRGPVGGGAVRGVRRVLPAAAGG